MKTRIGYPSIMPMRSDGKGKMESFAWRAFRDKAGLTFRKEGFLICTKDCACALKIVHGRGRSVSIRSFLIIEAAPWQGIPEFHIRSIWSPASGYADLLLGFFDVERMRLIG
jgi:hypothetical protein